MRVVLDTNVIISRFLTPHGSVAKIVDLWEQGAFELLVSEAILSEYDSVLRYPKLRRIHHLTDEQIEAIADGFREFAEFINVEAVVAVIDDDPDDDHLLACSQAGKADCLVTGDRHLPRIGQYSGIPILTPAEFLARYFAD